MPVTINYVSSDTRQPLTSIVLTDADLAEPGASSDDAMTFAYNAEDLAVIEIAYPELDEQVRTKKRTSDEWFVVTYVHSARIGASSHPRHRVMAFWTF